MLQEVKLPEISENVESGEVIEILVSAGDMVEKDQPLVELETEKAAFEVPSPHAGRIKEITIEEGQTVNIGQVIARIDTEAEGEPSQKQEAPEQERAADPERPQQAPEHQTKDEPAETPPDREEEQEQQAARPCKDHSQSPQAEESTKEKQEEPAQTGVPAAPSVRRLARELGLDISKVSGSGPGGRISDQDVKAHAKDVIKGGAAQSDAAPVRATVSQQRELPDFSQWGAVERKKLSKTRRTIAANLTYGWAHTPQVTQHDEADVTELEKFRRSQNQKVRGSDAKLSATAILVKVVASALRKFPEFNASLDIRTDELIIKKYYHIAVAVDTERGLLVPVIRDADTKSLMEISAELAELAKKARDKAISPDEMQGGGFTVSNLGGIGGTHFAPVVYWPHVAILGAAQTSKRVTLNDGNIDERLMLPLSLSYDHRVIDGADGTRFLRWIAQALQVPLLIVL